MIKYRAFCSFDSIGAKIRKRWDTDQIFGGVFLKKQKAWIFLPTHAFLFLRSILAYFFQQSFTAPTIYSTSPSFTQGPAGRHSPRLKSRSLVPSM